MVTTFFFIGTSKVGVFLKVVPVTVGEVGMVGLTTM